ncbi:ribosome small subunit-dependent GTPase A ['Fragaria x ananassa' phyllody phytoplasma]|uniref:Small ribosomal subunit biogenesis GTPase RsgA n=1 Tax='Fragaria x ananassa' phyllody phytoplasma TaxID=2358428 RepID=A0ABS5K2X6_9MOLU|nr:ribosome small subunit-dependent GTPase A ['Fragaria x ananassa' phyllody phytoplasma]MBS2126244.1 ribosome small subunit-dependent GTPase A ['Fragaria x ananassa' phyllody phytoplasma]
MRKALVIRFLAGVYDLQDLESKIFLQAIKRGTLKGLDSNLDVNKKNKINDKSKHLIIKVGDIVGYQLCYDKYLIDAVFLRKNELQRPNITNINQVLLVFSLIRPHFQTLLLDKFLLILKKQKLDLVLVFSKIDLLESNDLENIKQQIVYYEKFYPCYFVNSKQQIGIDVLKDIFANKITVLAGQTGVGKSTLLKSLIPDAHLKTQEISESLGRGKHTTKNAQLYEFNHGFIADTPGFSKLDLNDFTYGDLKDFYPDFLCYVNDCFFGNNCLHLQEDKCGVKQALEKSDLPLWRYQNYIYFMAEIKKTKKSYLR